MIQFHIGSIRFHHNALRINNKLTNLQRNNDKSNYFSFTVVTSNKMYVLSKFLYWNFAYVCYSHVCKGSEQSVTVKTNVQNHETISHLF